MRRARAATVVTLAALGLIGWLSAEHAGDVLAAIAAVPLWGFAAALGLHVGTLVLRSEAWGLALASIEARPLPRRWVHGANAAAFMAGAAQSQAALPTRVALLRRVAGSEAPRPAQICMADVPIFALELCLTSALLFAAGSQASSRHGSRPPRSCSRSPCCSPPATHRGDLRTARWSAASRCSPTAAAAGDSSRSSPGCAG